MANVTIQPVETRSQQKEFVGLPWKLYAQDPNWVPPLLQNHQELLGYQTALGRLFAKPHPFHAEAEMQTFLAIRDGQVCGRIAATIHHVHNRTYEEQRGFFGFFESINDTTVSKALFDVARDWLSDRGMRAIRGPMNPSFNYEMGLLVKGFDAPPTFMMTYNPPYYADLIEGWGFEKVRDMYAFRGHVEMVESLDEKMWFVIEESTRRFNIKLRPIDTSRFVDEVRLFLSIYNEANGNHWGFAPLTDGEIVKMANGMKSLIVPELTSMAEVDGKTVGTIFGMLDYNPRIKQIGGRLFPTGFLKILNGRRKLKRVRMLAAHVLPEFQRWGLGLVLANSVWQRVKDWGIEEVEFSWVMECNRLSRGTLERANVPRPNTYRLYDYNIAPT